ncbi:hypothetical protein OHA99_09235 [Streptomyces coelicoflavus]
MNGEAVLVSLIVAPRGVSFDVGDPAAEQFGDSGHDFGLRTALLSFDAGQVRVAYSDGGGESAQAVAAVFALPADCLSVWLHISNVLHETQRSNMSAS